jgi:2-polyprenyl-3-methyl-5-hydroxy-6-metoxy-1,4-benzoquinol methylase
MVSKYDTSVDLSNKNNSHTLIVESVGRGKRVLDVGASTGFLAEVLTGRGCSVTGIEIDPDAARQAEEFCERVIVGNVEELDLDAEIGAETFDVLVFGDVLEHLKDPQRALERFKPFLDPGGHVVASIPNIAHGSVRLALLQGKFRYRPLGLLDNTHLRFFTRESVEEMFGAAGFLISEVKRTRQDVFDTEIDVDAAEVPEEVVRLVRSDPEAFTYQFVLTAHPTGRAGTAEVLVHELAGKLRGLEDLRLMLDLRDRQLAEREREVERLTQEVSDLSGRLATLVQQGKADA